MFQLLKVIINVFTYKLNGQWPNSRTKGCECEVYTTHTEQFTQQVIPRITVIGLLVYQFIITSNIIQSEWSVVVGIKNWGNSTGKTDGKLVFAIACKDKSVLIVRFLHFHVKYELAMQIGFSDFSKYWNYDWSATARLPWGQGHTT